MSETRKEPSGLGDAIAGFAAALLAPPWMATGAKEFFSLHSVMAIPSLGLILVMPVLACVLSVGVLWRHRHWRREKRIESSAAVGIAVVALVIAGWWLLLAFLPGPVILPFRPEW